MTLLDGQVSRLRAFEDPVDVGGGTHFIGL